MLTSENALCAHPKVSQAAVVGITDDRWGETAVAFVVPEAEVQLTVDDLTGWCAVRLARYKVPSRITFVDELPHNATARSSRPRCARSPPRPSPTEGDRGPREVPVIDGALKSALAVYLSLT